MVEIEVAGKLDDEGRFEEGSVSAWDVETFCCDTEFVVEAVMTRCVPFVAATMKIRPIRCHIGSQHTQRFGVRRETCNGSP